MLHAEICALFQCSYPASYKAGLSQNKGLFELCLKYFFVAEMKTLQ